LACHCFHSLAILQQTGAFSSLRDLPHVRLHLEDTLSFASVSWSMQRQEDMEPEGGPYFHCDSIECAHKTGWKRVQGCWGVSGSW